MWQSQEAPEVDMNSTRRGWLSDAILRKFYPCLSSFFGLDKQKSTIKSDQVSKWLATFVPGVLDISEVANIRMTRSLTWLSWRKSKEGSSWHESQPLKKQKTHVRLQRRVMQGNSSLQYSQCHQIRTSEPKVQVAVFQDSHVSHNRKY